jgi:hypothetical protein
MLDQLRAVFLDNLPSWLNLLAMLGLVIITWWYARSTRDMARVMKATYETETTPQLGCSISNVRRTPQPPYLEVSFELRFINAGRYLINVKAVSVVGEAMRGSASTSLNRPLEVEAIFIAPNRDYFVPHEATKLTIRDDALNLRLKVDFEDFKGRVHSREFPLP